MKPWIALLVSGLLAGGSVSAADKPQPAPAWELKDLDGKAVQSSEFKGKVVLVDFWATWCPPCRAEIPGLNALQKELGPEGFVIVGVSLDDSPADVKRFLQKQPIGYPVVMGDQATAAKFGGVEAIPTKFLIDREGRIVWRGVGGSEKSELEQRIRPVLQKKP